MVAEHVCSPKQFDKRFYAHLSHHLSTMDPGGNVANPNYPADLLVRLTSHRQNNDLPLARRERLQSRTDRGELAIDFAPRSGFVNCQQYGLDQGLISIWFGQKLYRAGFHGLDGHLYVRVTRQENHWRSNTAAPEFSLKIQSARTSQPDIENNATWYVAMLPLPIFPRRGIQLDLQRSGFQQALQRFANR